MGGEGSMSSAILTLRQNRAMLKKRNIRELRDLYYETSGKTELEFKEISKLELFRIKKEIRKRARQDARRTALIYVLSFVLAIGVLYTLYWLFTS